MYIFEEEYKKDIVPHSDDFADTGDFDETSAIKKKFLGIFKTRNTYKQTIWHKNG